MKHKIRIDSNVLSVGRVWYVDCSCDWQPKTFHDYDGVKYFGRPTWDAAFALGVAHQKDKIRKCRCVGA